MTAGGQKTKRGLEIMAKRAEKAVAIIAAAGMLMSMLGMSAFADTPAESAVNTATEQSLTVVTNMKEVAAVETESVDTLYTEYIADYKETANPEYEITVYSGSKTLSENTEEVISTEITVPEAGLYVMEVTYKMTAEQSSQPAITVALNGNLPYYEAWQISLPQLFKDVKPVGSKDVEIPEAELVDEYQTRYLYDTLGYYGGLLEFYLKDGVNHIQIESALGAVEITEVKFTQYITPPTYKEAKKSFKYEKYTGDHKKVQAERVYRKSDSTIFAVNDRSSASVEPSSVYERYLNAIGGTNWQTLGQYVEWEIEVPEDGLYTINLKYRKDTKAGLDSNRRIYVDGKIPYKELESYKFKYTSTFKVETLSTENGEEMLFELKKGKHIIRMEVSIGEYSSVLPDIYSATQALQGCYRQFIMVMGTAPDSLRDYQLDTLIPEVLEEMKEQRKLLEKNLEKLEAITGASSSGTKLMMQLINQIKYFEEDSYYISGELQAFKSNIASVITWVLDVKVQPLKLDFITLSAPEKDPPKATKGMWHSIKYNVNAFVYTFSSDYEYANLDSDDPETLTVWDPSAATEFSIWRQMVNNDFIKKNPDIKINFKNVSTGFQQAFLAGMLPDVYVGMDVQSLMEFAFRDVIITDLTSVVPEAELTEALKNYNKWLYYPVKLDGKLYGFPMTTTVPATFYRTDIFEEMGLEIPEVLTWDDVIYISTMMQKKNLEVGLTPGIGTWKTLIYQKGGYTANEERKEVFLMNDLAIETFNTYTSFFTEYSSPVAFSAFDRFRTGEMPMVFADVSFINQLEVLAPEITGKWDFTHHPATLDENGNPDYTVGGGSTSYMVITNRRPEMADEAWEFIKWRGSTETLVSINRRLEMSIGRSVRAISPNAEAQDRIPWSTKVQKLYDFYNSYENNAGDSWRFSEPEVPGDYFVQRAYTNAWTAVYYQDAVPGDALKLYIPTANAEITRRREYFGMDD